MEILAKSRKTYLSSLDPFSIWDQDVSLQETRFLQIIPVSAIDNDGPISLRIPKSHSLYYNLGDSYLYLKCKVVNADGTSLASTDNVTVSNLFFYSLFSNCSVELNGVRVSDSAGRYHYCGVVPNILGVGEAVKHTKLSEQFWYPDTKVDSFTETTNDGFKTRKALTLMSKAFEVMGRPASSVFETGRVFIPGTEFEITFTRNSPSIYLDSDTATKTGQIGIPWKVVILECSLFVKTYKINPEIQNRHELALQRGTKAIYPLNELVIRPTQIPIGQIKFDTTVNFSKRIPNFVAIALLDVDAYSGKLTKSFQNFGANGLISITLKFGASAFAYQRLDFDFENGSYLRAYHSIFSALPAGSTTGNSISRSEYANGNTIFVFELNDAPSNQAFVPQRAGDLMLELEFKTATTKNIQLLVFGKQTNVLTIDKDRNPVFP